jgi:DNA repair protein RecN (Recombination protein N)
MILKQLRLINFATFEFQEVNFSSSLNAIIGETGSGKSLILEALELILGHRADKKLVRKNCKFSTIEAIFSTNEQKMRNYFDNIGHPFEEDEIVLKRIIYSNGQTKSFINHQSCNLSLIKNFSRKFIDLVGQFENQKLLFSDYQLNLLDSFGKNLSICEKFRLIFNEYKQFELKLNSLLNNSKDKEQKKDFLNYQIKELTNLGLDSKEELDLNLKFKELQDLQKSQDSIHSVVNLISDGEVNIQKMLHRSKLELLQNSKTSDFVDNLENAYNLIEEVSFKLSNLLSNDLDPLEFERVANRLDDYQKLKRKYDCTTEEIVEKLVSFTKEKENLLSLDDQIESLRSDIERKKNEAYKIALVIHEQRLGASKVLSKKLTKYIQNLKMKDASISINIKKEDDLNENGCSSLQFLAETNPGEGFHLIKEIASGGELSRILLAVRQILSNQDSVSVFLFDEIDTGMGGETALCIGNALKEVSNGSQVIAITHLPQIAVNADKLIIVSKEQVNSKEGRRTISKIKEVVGTCRKKEIELMTPLNQ